MVRRRLCTGERGRSGFAATNAENNSLTHTDLIESTKPAGVEPVGRNQREHVKKQTLSKNSLGGKQVFAFTAPGASSVQLAGDFTLWNQAPVNLKKDADGVWRTNLELTPGEHHYRFLVDGQWCDDPQCEFHVPNPYGTQDAVRQVT